MTPFSMLVDDEGTCGYNVTFRSASLVLKMTPTAEGSLKSTLFGPYATTGPYFLSKSSAMSAKLSWFQNFLASQKLDILACYGPGMCLRFQYWTKNLRKRVEIASTTTIVGAMMGTVLL